MKLDEMLTFGAIALLFILMAWAIISTAKESSSLPLSSLMEREGRGRAEPLPVRCREFYNDGTDQWMRCMNVEYK